jgi:hypothetical protein
MNQARLPTFLSKYIKGFQERETFFSFFPLRFRILAPPLFLEGGEGGVRGTSKVWKKNDCTGIREEIVRKPKADCG